MALTTAAAFLHLGNILSIGGNDVTETSTTPKVKLGMLSIVVDAFGYHRIFRYCRLMAAGAPGLVFDRVALVTGTVTAVAGELNDTTHLADTTNFTAGDEEGKICQINVAGGAAPEGETALITDSTTTQLTFDPGYPLSAAPASGDTYSDWGVQHFDAGALASNNINCAGILMGTPAAKDYGWCQIHGFHPAVQVDPNSAAITADAAGQMGATSYVVLLSTGASQQQDYIGWFPMATSTTAVQAAFVIDVFGQAQPVS